MSWIEYTVAALFAWNLIVFTMYGIDKRKAKRGDRRIRESVLLTVAAIMGAAGALLGMYCFRHKINNKKFVIGVPLLLFVNIAIAALVYMNTRLLKTPEHQQISLREAKFVPERKNARGDRLFL